MTDATRRAVLSAVGGLVGAGSATGLPTGSTPNATRSPTAVGLPPRDDLEAFVDETMEARVGEVTPGLTVAVVEGDDVVLAKGYGHADTTSGRPVRADGTTFQIGSVSKLVTWTAVMQGVEDGVLELDADVDAYLGDSRVTIPDTYEAPVTLGALGTHTAGFESRLPAAFEDPADLTSIETALVERRPDRVRPPGEAVEYSNWGTMLAGHVVAEAHDTTFEEYVRTEVFEPLGMEHSTFRQPVPTSHPGERARPHERREDGFAPTASTWINARPAGSMSATATDMAAFMRAHLNDGAVEDGRILEAGTVDTMHRRHHVRHPAVNNWRYGFYEHGPVGGGAIGHSGSTGSFESQLVLVPGQDVGVFVGYNAAPSGGVVAGDVDRILREYDLLPGTPPPTPATASGRRRRAEAVAAEYAATAFSYDDGPERALGLLSRVTVDTVGDGRLATRTLTGSGIGGSEWVETDPYVYREVGGDDVLAFDVADGSVGRMYVSSVPQTAYEPVPLADRAPVTGGVVAGAAGGFLLSLLGWAGATAWRGRECLHGDRAGDREPRSNDAAGGPSVDEEVTVE
jgi:CubicO group peptidase (beta-lactamase class C family)